MSEPFSLDSLPAPDTRRMPDDPEGRPASRRGTGAISGTIAGLVVIAHACGYVGSMRSIAMGIVARFV
jgi:hypothetical protein